MKTIENLILTYQKERKRERGRETCMYQLHICNENDQNNMEERERCMYKSLYRKQSEKYERKDERKRERDVSVICNDRKNMKEM